MYFLSFEFAEWLCFPLKLWACAGWISCDIQLTLLLSGWHLILVQRCFQKNKHVAYPESIAPSQAVFQRSTIFCNILDKFMGAKIFSSWKLETFWSRGDVLNEKKKIFCLLFIRDFLDIRIEMFSTWFPSHSSATSCYYYNLFRNEKRFENPEFSFSSYLALLHARVCTQIESPSVNFGK